MTDYVQKIYNAAKPVMPEIEISDVTPSEQFCDYCIPCFKLAKTRRKNPAVIAAECAELICVDGAEVTALNGYVNFTVQRTARINDVLTATIGEQKPLLGKTVCIDYSSVNIAKPFHIGHLMTTVIGGALYNIYKALGAKTIGINHLGDFGTQFGGLISAYRRWGDEQRLQERGLDELLDLYVRFNKEEETDPGLAEEARSYSQKIESAEPYAVELFEKFKSITLAQATKVYERLNIKFDSYLGERYFVDKVPSVVSRLKSRGLIKISDGATIVDLSEYDMPPAIIMRGDGASLYIARDLAAAYYRKETYGFDKCLYVVASHQALHFKQLFKVLELMDEPWANDMVHVSYGMVSVQGAALSSRRGNVVYLNDVLNAAAEKAKAIIRERNPDLADKDRVAESVGVGAVVFDALYDGRQKDKDFSLADALNFDGETGPYVQYTHARCLSALNKANVKNINYASFNRELLADDCAYEVVKLLADFDEAVYNAAVKYEPSIVSRRLIKICRAFNKFYANDRIMCGGELQTARLALTQITANALRYGLNLILVDAPEHM